MISLTFVFYLFVILLAIIGAMRGWAKELLVVFSVILAMFIILVFESYVGVYQRLLQNSPATTWFWSRTIVVLLLAFFGYQTPSIKPFQVAARREKVRDAVLGAVVGGLNGWLVIGSIWWFLAKAGYENFPTVIVPPTEGSELAGRAADLLTRMPPEYLMQAPQIYIAIAIAFTFVVIVYV